MTTATASAAYERIKARQAAANRAKAAAGRDIGDIPAVEKPERRERARREFRYFCEQYFPDVFCLAWSEDHLRVLEKVERAVLEGGQFAMAMPRGSGKTSICEAASLWALLYGHRRCVAVIGPDEGHAETCVENLRAHLESNQLLLEDFPHVCYPIQCLEGISQRRLLYHGELVRMRFTAKRLMFPILPGSEASGAVVATAGITGQIRGLGMAIRDEGRVTKVRPDFVLVDDPQTDESARSPSQCAQREAILNGAILGLAGPGQKISAIMPCTVVREGDLADRILNRDQNPQWQGERTKLVYSWPNRTDLWERYMELRREAQREDREPVEAHKLYADNRAAMDEGAKVAWPERKNADELSALQHAYNIRADRKDHAFFAEYQNEPLPDVPTDDTILTAEEIAQRTNGYKRREVPSRVTCLTAMVDISDAVLWWMVCGWEPDFTGYVLDYGAEPEQKRSYYTLADARNALLRAYPGRGQEAAWRAALESLADKLLVRDWHRDDGAEMRIERMLIDEGYERSAQTVRDFCRQTPHAANVMPSRGRYIGAATQPLTDGARKPGDRVGLNWRVRAIQGTKIRSVHFDSNFWKSFVHSRLATAVGDRGSLTVFKSTQPHRMLGDQLASEVRVRTQGRGRTVDEWRVSRPGIDNHWLDCLVGCAVAASMHGCAPAGVEARPMKAQKPRKTFAERYAKWKQ